MNSFDNAGFHWFNHFAGHHRVLDTLMAFFAQYALEIYVVLFVVAWFTLPKNDTNRRHALVVSVVSGIFSLVVNVIIAHVWIRPRPFTVLPKGEFTQLIPHANDASFPSDHTSGSFGFAAASWGKSTKWVSYTFTILAFIVMVSRLYCGVHWPTDVIAGLVVGTLCGRLTWKLSKFIFPITNLGLKLFRMGQYSSKSLPSHRTRRSS